MDTREEHEQTTTGPGPAAVHYQVRVAGRLPARWATWFEGLSITAESDGATVLEGPITDQAALHGVLQKVRDLGLQLRSVSRIERA